MATRTIIILTLNEVDGVRWLLDEGPDLFEMAEEVVSVDGGSTDGTRELLESANIRVIDQEINGRGEAFRVAVNATRGDHLVFFSPDGNEDPGDIPGLFELLEKGANIAIASRFLAGSRNEEDDLRFPFRKWANQAFSLTANLFWNKGPYVSDTINGFRGITRSAFLGLAPTSIGYSIEYEITIRAMKMGLILSEMPTREGNRVGGVSKAPSILTGIRFTRFLIKEVFRGRSDG